MTDNADYERPSGYGARCDHGRLARSCETCDLLEAEDRIAALEAENDALREVITEAELFISGRTRGLAHYDKARTRLASIVNLGGSR